MDTRSGADVQMEPGRPEAIEQSFEREGVPVVERGHDMKLVGLPIDAVGELVDDAALARADEPAANSVALDESSCSLSSCFTGVKEIRYL